ncbi:hypothetical protein MIR68_005778 [Amoeboaphelidium protococcarum]|nr:hypothetical protein MIR68_005778 [Amoeboaphelidium protococcarum]KAI3646586.1 hypothetical protein MP228_009514 [Amoeboaphelidium protococcarum]KAI3646939.1 hypothetical protein MP228_007160 [Amoeboaphelidium protococcarum]
MPEKTAVPPTVGTANIDPRKPGVAHRLEEAALKAENAIKSEAQAVKGEAKHLKNKAKGAAKEVAAETRGWVAAYNNWRKSWGLPNPGKFEGMTNEVRGVFANQMLFDGAKFDFGKVLSPNFQVMHSFMLGSQVAPQQYSFGTFFTSQQWFLRGVMDNDQNLNASVSYSPLSNLALKLSPSMGPQVPTSVGFEVDYTGLDYSTYARVAHAAAGNQIVSLSHLQSVTKGLAVGVEAALQKLPEAQFTEPQLTYVAKYQAPDYKATVSYCQLGIMQATYFQKISEQVELGADLQVVNLNEQQRESVCTLGAKWDFRAASVRAQVDTTGRVATFMEQRLGPGFSFLMSADLNHSKGTSKFGLGLQLEN